MVCIRDANTGRRLLELGTNGLGRTRSVQFSPNGRYLATATEPYGLRIWAIEPKRAGGVRAGLEVRLVQSWTPGPTPNRYPGDASNLTPMSLAFAQGGSLLAFSCYSSRPNPVAPNLASNDGALYVWDCEGSAQPREVTSNILASELCESFTPDGHSLFTVATNGVVMAVDVTSGKEIRRLDAQHEEPEGHALCLSPDGSKFAVCTASGLDLRIRDAMTGNLLFPLPPESGQIAGFAWSPDSRRLAVSFDNGNIAIWDLEKVNQILAQLGLNP